jgi:hypothetical protein
MRRSVEGNVIIGPVVVFLVLIANTILSNQAANTLARDGELVAHSHETQTAIEDALSTVLQAESNAHRQAGERRRTGYWSREPGREFGSKCIRSVQ